MIQDDPLARFDQHLKDLGYPIEGVSKKGDEIRIDCKACTEKQLVDAKNEAVNYDWSVKPDLDIKAEIEAIKARLDKLEGN